MDLILSPLVNSIINGKLYAAELRGFIIGTHCCSQITDIICHFATFLVHCSFELITLVQKFLLQI